VGLWNYVVAAVTSVILRCLHSAADTQAAVEGDTVRFRRSSGIQRLGFFPLGAAMLLTAFLFGLSRQGFRTC
jgi:hypothetical protein